MGQARRRSPRKAQGKGGSRSGAALFLTGVVAGALAMLLGLRWDQLEPGGGLRTLLERPAVEPAAPPVVVVPQPVETPRLEFYEVLPEFERLMPNPEPAPTAASTPPPAAGTDRQTPVIAAIDEQAATVDRVRYVLQAGSYTSHADADRLKAELAMLGMESHIQQVTIEDRGVFYRVRLGPFESVGELDRLDARLREQGLQPLRLRVTGAAG